MMRVFTVVTELSEQRHPSDPTFASESNHFSLFPAPSLPMMLKSSVGTPRAAKLRATLAAPPGMNLSRSNCTTGTGASGEILFTEPQINSSSMISPNTRILGWVASVSRCLTRRKLSPKCVAAGPLHTREERDGVAAFCRRLLRHPGLARSGLRPFELFFISELWTCCFRQEWSGHVF